MTFTIPPSPLLKNQDFDDAGTTNDRGYMTGAPYKRNIKSEGGLPMTVAGSYFTHNNDGLERGAWWEFYASGGIDSSTDNHLIIGTFQYNAPNRLEIDTVANGGCVYALGCGTGSPPTVWRKWYIGGHDTPLGSAREFPIFYVIDTHDTSYDASNGTWAANDIECSGFGGKQYHLGGTTFAWFMSRHFVFETTKGATDIPRFTGTSDWDDTVTAMGVAHDTKISHGWILREGTVFSIACPIEIGDGSTLTNFNDNGVSVFYPDHNDPDDPRVRVTENAFRFYLNLSAASSATFSGLYDCGTSYPLWDFDQDNGATVTLSGATFKRTGTFKMGGDVTGNATFDGCGMVDCMDNGVDLDGSAFKNPHGTHLLSLAL